MFKHGDGTIEYCFDEKCYFIYDTKNQILACSTKNIVNPLTHEYCCSVTSLERHMESMIEFLFKLKIEVVC